MLVGSRHGPEPYDWSMRPPSRPKATYSEIGDKARHNVRYGFEPEVPPPARMSLLPRQQTSVRRPLRSVSCQKQCSWLRQRMGSPGPCRVYGDVTPVHSHETPVLLGSHHPLEIDNLPTRSCGTLTSYAPTPRRSGHFPDHWDRFR